MLENVKIAKPCSADWNAMSGDERVRFCQQCKLNVYNLSNMTRTEAEDLLTKTEGSVCVRLYQRADGTVITRDCPVGLAAIKKRVATFAASVFAVLAVGFSAFARTNDEVDGPRFEPTSTTRHKDPVVTPRPHEERVLMGAPVAPQRDRTPPKEPEEPMIKMGAVQAR